MSETSFKLNNSTLLAARNKETLFKFWMFPTCFKGHLNTIASFIFKIVNNSIGIDPAHSSKNKKSRYSHV